MSRHRVAYVLIYIGGALVFAGMLLLAGDPDGVWWNLGPQALGAALVLVGALVALSAHRKDARRLGLL